MMYTRATYASIMMKLTCQLGCTIYDDIVEDLHNCTIRIYIVEGLYNLILLKTLYDCKSCINFDIFDGSKYKFIGIRVLSEGDPPVWLTIFPLGVYDDPLSGRDHTQDPSVKIQACTSIFLQ